MKGICLIIRKYFKMETAYIIFLIFSSNLYNIYKDLVSFVLFFFESDIGVNFNHTM